MELPPSDEGKDPLKEQWRGFHVTINSNCTGREIVGPLRVVWEYIVAHASKFLRGRPGGRLLEVRQYYNVERSVKFHKYHIHSYFTCKTLGFSLFDLNKLRKFINVNLRQVKGFVGARVLVQAIRQYNIDQMLEDYIGKDPVGEVEGEKEQFEIIPPDV